MSTSAVVSVVGSVVNILAGAVITVEGAAVNNISGAVNNVAFPFSSSSFLQKKLLNFKILDTKQPIFQTCD